MGTPTHLAFTTEPSNAVAGVSLSPNIVVKIEDATNAVITGDTSVVVLTIHSGPSGGDIFGNLIVQAVAGVCTFTAISFQVVGSYEITASVLGANPEALTAATSTSFTISFASIHQLAFEAQPTTTVAGSTISPSVTVQVQDQYGNLVTSDSSSVITMAIFSGPTSTLGGTLTQTSSSGIVTFNNLVIDAVGNYVLLATDIAQSLVESLSGSGGFNITPAAAYQLIISQEPSNIVAQDQFYPVITVQVLDYLENLVTSDSSNVTLAIDTGATGVSLTGTLTVAAQNGVATFTGVSINQSVYSNTPVNTPSTITLKATDGSLIQAVSNNFIVYTNLFTKRPDSPLSETLRFLTDVLNHKDGTEQRISLRVAPRTVYDLRFSAEDGNERQLIENFLYGAEDQVVLIPIWTEGSYLTSQASSGATTIDCNTQYSLFGGNGNSLILISPDDSINELHQHDIASTTSSSITLTTALQNNWPAGTEVYPVKRCVIPKPTTNKRYPTNYSAYATAFWSIEDKINLAAGAVPSGFTTISFGDDSGILVLDDPNWMSSTLGETNDFNVQVIDGDTGTLSAFSYWLHSRRGSVRTFVTVFNRTKIWSLKILLHYLNGKQTSFLLPIFANDITPTEDLTATGTMLTIVNNGFTLYNAVSNNGRKYVRVYLTDGSYTDHQVIESTVSSSTVEQITVTPAWASTVLLENIKRITFLEKVRCDADDMTIQYNDLAGTAKVSFPTKAVLE
jgi:hypothetical protein